MKQPAAWLSLPLILAMVLAPPPPAVHDDSLAFFHSTRDVHDDVWRQLNHEQSSWNAIKEDSRLVEVDDSDDEDDVEVSKKNVVRTSSALITLTKPPVARLTPRAFMLMLDYMARTKQSRTLESSLAGIASTLDRHHVTPDHPFVLNPEDFVARPERVRALASLLSAALFRTRSMQGVKMVEYETVYVNVPARIRVPDHVVFQLACYAKDRRVTEYLLSMRQEPVEATGVFDEMVSQEDAHLIWRMLRSYPQLRHYGKFVDEAKEAMQVAWMDQTIRKKDAWTRNVLRDWLFDSDRHENTAWMQATSSCLVAQA